jgi:hypothetical protein
MIYDNKELNLIKMEAIFSIIFFAISLKIIVLKFMIF